MANQVTHVYECDSCGYETSGYRKNELEQEGWKWQTVKNGRDFVMCDLCVTHYEKRWAVGRS